MNGGDEEKGKFHFIVLLFLVVVFSLSITDVYHYVSTWDSPLMV